MDAKIGNGHQLNGGVGEDVVVKEGVGGELAKEGGVLVFFSRLDDQHRSAGLAEAPDGLDQPPVSASTAESIDQPCRYLTSHPDCSRGLSPQSFPYRTPRAPPHESTPRLGH